MWNDVRVILDISKKKEKELFQIWSSSQDKEGLRN